MKAKIQLTLEVLAAVLAMILVLWPWTLALCDLAHYGVYGYQLTSIPWNHHRGWLLLAWPLAAMAILELLTA